MGVIEQLVAMQQEKLKQLAGILQQTSRHYHRDHYAHYERLYHTYKCLKLAIHNNQQKIKQWQKSLT